MEIIVGIYIHIEFIYHHDFFSLLVQYLHPQINSKNIFSVHKLFDLIIISIFTFFEDFELIL